MVMANPVLNTYYEQSISLSAWEHTASNIFLNKEKKDGKNCVETFRTVGDVLTRTVPSLPVQPLGHVIKS